MLQFIRRWYILVGLVGLLGAMGLIWLVPPFDKHPAVWMLLNMIPFLFVAILLATRGFGETTILRLAICIYLVFLIPTGLYMFLTDVADNRNNGWINASWSNTKFWLGFGLEGGFIVSPVVFGFAALFTTFYNSLRPKE